MIPYWSNGRVVLWQGHVLDCLAAMEAGSVHCAISSPPYWGLRDYDLPSLEWPAVSYAQIPGSPPLDIPGCDPECGHVWGEERVAHQRGSVGTESTINGPQSGGRQQEASQGQYCQLCGGWRGCLGLEPTPEMFVGHIVLVARALWRVLRDDGTFWLNFGDSYATGAGKVGKCPGGGKQGENWQGLTTSPNRLPQKGLKPKDLIGIPWRVAFALQADGWYLRSDIIWAKGVSFCPTYSGSCMPESVRDRPTKGHEYVFLLSKNKRYFYDGDAVREKLISKVQRFLGTGRNKELDGSAPAGSKIKDHRAYDGVPQGNPAGRNLRTVWTINPGSYAGAHFATFPPALVEPMIKAGTSARGCCGAMIKKLKVREGLTEQEQEKVRLYLESKDLL